MRAPGGVPGGRVGRTREAGYLPCRSTPSLPSALWGVQSRNEPESDSTRVDRYLERPLRAHTPRDQHAPPDETPAPTAQPAAYCPPPDLLSPLHSQLAAPAPPRRQSRVPPQPTPRPFPCDVSRRLAPRRSPCRRLISLYDQRCHALPSRSSAQAIPSSHPPPAPPDGHCRHRRRLQTRRRQR